MVVFGDIGKSAKDVISGGRTGVFQYDQKLTIASSTADGVTWTAKAVNKGEKLDAELKGAFKGKVTGDVTLSSAGKVAGNVTLPPMAPGLKMVLSGNLPVDAEKKSASLAKLAVDYALSGVALKSSVTLNTAPTIDLSAATAVQNVAVGAECGYDVGKQALTKWGAAVGYSGPSYAAALLLSDSGKKLKASYYHDINAKTSAAAEVTRNLCNADTAMALGYCRTLDTGAKTKSKIDSSGVVSVLWEQKVDASAKLGMSMQFNALNLAEKPKVGLALDL